MPYLRIGMVVALAAGILAVGVLGPHPSPGPGSTPEPTGSLLAALPSAGPSAIPSPATAGPAGLARFSPAPADVRTSWLPNNIASQSLAAIGTRLFFVVGTSRLESTVIGSTARPKTLASAPPCAAINQVAAAGNVLAYVQTSPVGGPAGSAACARTGSVAWTIWFADLGGGHPRRIASGIRSVDSATTRMYPVRLALTLSMYAFNRPNSPGTMAQGETVEVRSVGNDRLLWTVQTDAHVADLMIGGSTLAVLERDGDLELNIADTVNPALTPVARPVSAAALSADGRYVAWDTAGDDTSHVPAGVVALQLPSGGRTLQEVPSDSPSPTPLRPVVSSTSVGPIVAWYATVADGAVYPAFRDYSADGSGFYSIVRAPVWIALSGSTLITVTTDRDGGYTVAFAVDLSRSGFKAS